MIINAIFRLFLLHIVDFCQLLQNKTAGTSAAGLCLTE